MQKVTADEAEGDRLRKKAQIFLLIAAATVVFDIVWFLYLQPAVFGMPSSWGRVLFNVVVFFAPLMLLVQAWGNWVESLVVPRRHRTAVDCLVLGTITVVLGALLFFSAQQAVDGILYGTVRLRHGVVVNVADHPIIYGVYEGAYIICAISIIIAAVRLPRAWVRWKRRIQR